MFLDNLYIMCL